MRTMIIACALAACVPGSALAFCGFYVSGGDAELFNDATMVVMMREGTQTVLSMQNDYKGPPEDFALVVPVPEVLDEERVKTLSPEVFDRVDRLAAPRLVEYWEQDPCAPQVYPSAMAVPMGGARTASRMRASAAEGLGVVVEAEFAVGEYQIVILSAEDSSGLDTWLRREGYNIPDGAEPLLRPYVEEDMKFFVAKVDTSKVTFEEIGGVRRAVLSPLRVHYTSEEFRLPVRLGLVNASGPQDLIVHILARGQRYEAANYANVTIPTNLDVHESVRNEFGAFYVSLFDETQRTSGGAVVTEYSWGATSCDPCPGPTLTPGDLMLLGADVTGGMGIQTRGPRRVRRGFGSGFVLTRLHARYEASSLGEDLVFRAAPGIVGGREIRNGEGELEHGASPSGMNNFQGRYAIRHEWEGPIECDEPVRGRWGGPWPGVERQEVAAARDLAYASRGAVQLRTALRSPVPELGLAAVVPPSSEETMEASPSSEMTEDTVEGAPEVEGDAATSGSGCGCGASGAPNAAWVLALVVLGLRRRR